VIKTIFIVIGSIFALLFAGIALKAVYDAQDDMVDGGKVLEVQATTSPDSAIISWKTDVEADGVVHYGDRIVRSTEFKKIHRVELNGITYPLAYYIESCDLVGGCFKSTEYNLTYP
jgi:hypothetical protein